MIISNKGINKKDIKRKKIRLKAPLYIGTILNITSIMLADFNIISRLPQAGLGVFGSAIIVASLYYITVFEDDEKQFETYKYIIIFSIALSLFTGVNIYFYR